MTEAELRSIPKVELHRHLDGSVRLETILDLVRRHNLDVGTRDRDEIARRAVIREPLRSLQEVLDRFELLRSVLCRHEAIRRVAYENVEDAWRDGVRLVELRFAPSFIAHGKDLGYDEIIEGVLDGVSRGMAAWPVQVVLIGIAARARPTSENERALDTLLRYRSSGHRSGDRIRGFDLADGEEADPALFRPLVERARSAGLGITVHTGESTTAAHVKRSVEVYAPDRIGHGIRSWGDEEALELLRSRGIPLEVCPTSNWLTSSVPSLAGHPIRSLHDAGVTVTLSSDDPHLMGIDLVHEYAVCAEVHGFDHAIFRGMNEAALASSFADEDVKQWVRKRW